MASGKQEKPSKRSKENKKTSLKNPRSNSKFKKKNIKKQPPTILNSTKEENDCKNQNQLEFSASASQQLSFFVNEFQSANGLHLSSLELESINETSFLELCRELGQDVNSLGKQMKAAFGSSWKQVLCDEKLVEGEIEAGSPAVLFITTSAMRVIELLRGVRSLTKECHAAKLFSKHMKVEEQVTVLKDRVNFASGTPSSLL